MKDFYTLADLRKWKPEKVPIRLGVFGDPVAHSLSPKMQNAALVACGIEMRYAAFHILPNELSEALALLPHLGFAGINLTIPHKAGAIVSMSELDPLARTVGAINTVCVEGNKLVGCNTDGLGFARAIREEFSAELRDLRVLVVGATGGAGRAIAQQCILANSPRLVLMSRDFLRTKKLAEQVGGTAMEWRESTLQSLFPNIDLVVNATPLGMKKSDPAIVSPSLLAPHLMVYETIYTPAPTQLIEAAAAAGARSANGLSMLLHQGALAFEKWFERAAPIEIMRAALLD